jgi:hypothetical protein
MKLNYDERLSNFAFNFNLRRYFSVEAVSLPISGKTRAGFETPEHLSSHAGYSAGGAGGRGLHLSTFQLNLSRF